MDVAIIHNERRLGTGAHHINDLMAKQLRRFGVSTRSFYPRTSLVDAPVHLRGLQNILFFYSLLERRSEILRYDIIQGTTYAPLPFLSFPVPVVSHFGSTTRGFLAQTPLASRIEGSLGRVWRELRRDGVIPELNIRTRRPLRDIADIEEYVASRATAVIASSDKVRSELLASGVPAKSIHLIHNAVEDYWFQQPAVAARKPGIVFLGRLGSDVFTLKLKGLDRLVDLYRRFPEQDKTTLCMTTNRAATAWLRVQFPRHQLFVNVRKDELPSYLQQRRGSVLFLPSRYEGFSLSLIEGMSQGLVPVSYRVGVAPEVIRDGQNGFLVRTQAEAARRVSQVLGDSRLRRRLSAAAATSARGFRSVRIAQDLIGLYSEIVAGSSCGMRRGGVRRIRVLG